MLRPARPSLALVPLVALALGSAASRHGDEARLFLPEGAVARAWDRVEATTVPIAELEPWPAWLDGDGWDEAEPWRRWVELVRAEAGAEAPDARRRGQLALLALEQRRDADAWRHLAACAAEPAVLARVLPRFFPGVPAGHPIEAGGRPAPLSDGVLLTPSVPPPNPVRRDARDHGIVGQSMAWRGLTVGETTVHMKLSVEPDGVEIDFVHVDGPPAGVLVRLPCPPGVRIGAVYADWMARDDVAAPCPLAITGEEDEHAIWGRFLPSGTRWPERVPDRLPTRIEHGGLAVVVPDAAAPPPRAARFAEALGRLLGAPCELRSAGPPPAETFERVVVRLDGDDAGPKLTSMVSLVERFVLDAAGPEAPR